jgi:hypothetical protein
MDAAINNTGLRTSFASKSASLDLGCDRNHCTGPVLADKIISGCRYSSRRDLAERESFRRARLSNSNENSIVTTDALRTFRTFAFAKKMAT